jgi:hypothetical protein
MALRDTALEWLRGKDPGSIAGYRKTPDRCPLANLLREVGGAPFPLVGPERYRTSVIPPDDARKPLSAWARAAVRAVDDGGPKDTPITVGETLALWEGIPP